MSPEVATGENFRTAAAAGCSITVFELLQAQVQLSGAQATLLNAYTSYQQALIAYERATWTLLDKLNLQVAQR